MASRRVTRSMQDLHKDKDKDTTKSTERTSPVRLHSSSSSMAPLACIPTRLEQFLIAIYPATLLLGSLFSILNPVNRAAPYSADSQSHPASHAPSYFARKSNIFNRYFVKVGWFWTTFAFFVFLATHSTLRTRQRLRRTKVERDSTASSSSSPAPQQSRSTNSKIHAVIRYATITMIWAAMTQWFFGSPLIDRVFGFTGGQCELLADQESHSSPSSPSSAGPDMSTARKVATHAACKAIGGKWKGGHDISGHVFILILGSAMLWLEIMPVVLAAAGVAEQRRIRTEKGTVIGADYVEPSNLSHNVTESRVYRGVENAAHGSEDSEQDDTLEEPGLGFGVQLGLGVVALSWWMLLMTAAYFHTWFEKFTGFVVAFTAIGAVYFAPREIPALRRVLGMPGLS